MLGFLADNLIFPVVQTAETLFFYAYCDIIFLLGHLYISTNMEEEMAGSKLMLVKSHLAFRYMNEEKTGKSNPAECIQSMAEDTQKGISRVQASLGCSVWIAAQKCAVGMVSYDQRFIPDKTKKLKPEEISAIVDLGLHSHFGSPLINFSWLDVEKLQQLEINQSLEVSQIAEDCLPSSLWVEITGNPSAGTPSWIGKTAGILLTRIPLHGSEKGNVVSNVKNLPQWKHIVDMLQALCECEGRCLGYFAITAQNESSGFRFVPTIFGYDETGTVGDILQLHKEITKDRKFKGVERFAAELCIRAILARKTSPGCFRHATAVVE